MGATARNIDFKNVKEGGNFNKARIPAGDYLAKIVKVEDAESKSDKTPQYLFTIQIVKRPSSKLPYYCKLQENQLWKLRNILIAAGKNVPKSKIKVDVNSIVGKNIGVTVEDTEYEEKEQSEIAGVFPAAELGDADDTDIEADEEDSEDDEDLEDLDSDEADDDADEADDDEEEEADPYADFDRSQLKAEIAKLQPGFQARKSQSDDDLRGMLNALISNSSDDEEDEEEEEEEAPAPKKKAAAAPAKKTSTKKRSSKDVTDDELEELDIDDL